ncbi:MAG TPA: histone deacetylase [Thermoanaerobaculia bacterium]|nr:histone deacetylase [Thermoanaerobaculia bacterium]
MISLFTDPRCLQHRIPRGFPERPERLERLLAGLQGAGHTVQRPGEHPGVGAAVERVHGARYVQRFRQAVERREGLIDSADNPLTSSTLEAAWGAVAAALHAADRLGPRAGTADPTRRCFVAVRPPGHHAEREMAMGFCYFNTIAVVAEHLRHVHGYRRLAIFDFDVHHGNGTQHLFEEDRDLFYVSTHQYPFYPGTGAADERGRGPGEGATLNVPLPAGTSDAGYAEALQGMVLPALDAFAPELLLLSAGFDAWRLDPLGGMQVTAAGYRQWGEWLRALADRRCGGRVLALLEGGYDLDALPELVLAFLEGLDTAPGQEAAEASMASVPR